MIVSVDMLILTDFLLGGLPQRLIDVDQASQPALLACSELVCEMKPARALLSPAGASKAPGRARQGSAGPFWAWVVVRRRDLTHTVEGARI